VRWALVQLVARLRASRLDRALVAGADPLTSPALAAHAERLQGHRAREAAAAAIYQTLKDASVAMPPFSHRVPVAREAVRRNRPELLELAAELRQAGRVSARGVAATRLLIEDGTGPLYGEGEHGALRAAILRTRSLL
jgi:hypothetical protein